jgi:hypothetical protein
MNVCATTLGPGIAAYQAMSNAGTLCDLAPFDNTIAAICRTAAGAARNAAMWPADKKVLCALLCCCNANPVPSASGATNRYQGCVSDTLNAAQSAMGGDSRFKPEVSYNMRANPPLPLMERGLLGLGGLSTTPIPPTREGFGHMNNRIERDFPGQTPFGGSNTRRPDVTIVNDASRPPTQDNIFRLVEMKFPGDTLGASQSDAYDRIGGRATTVLDVQSCGCGDDDNTQGQVAFVTAAKAVRDAQISAGERVLFGVGAVLALIGTGIAIASPFEGPAGDYAMGTLTAGLATRVFASSALSAAARQALARAAASNWLRVFGGAVVAP